MKISIILNTQRIQKDGTCAVRMRFSENIYEKQFITYSSLGIFGTADEFDKVTGLFLLNNTAVREQNRRNNVIISKELDRAERLLHGLKMDGKQNITPAEFKKLFEGKETTKQKTFSEFYTEFMNDKEGRTKDVYLYTSNKLLKFYDTELKFEDIDYTFLRGFEKKCRLLGNKTNTISIDLRNIRAVWNEAQRFKFGAVAGDV